MNKVHSHNAVLTERNEVCADIETHPRYIKTKIIYRMFSILICILKKEI